MAGFLGGVIRVKGTKLQMKQSGTIWYEWEGDIVAGGIDAARAGELWVKGNNLQYYDNIGQPRLIDAPDGGLTAQPAGKLWAGIPAVGVRYFAWIDFSLHSRTGHRDTVHSDHDDDIVHSDAPHVDSHTDTHSDTAHTDVPHSDSHTDSHGDVAYSDVAHVDFHGDTHVDHTDGGHADAHGDAYGDTHTDIAYVDTHSDIAHSDIGHSDVAHVDTHGDVAHGDHTDNTPAYDDHDDTGHIDLPSLMP